MASRATQGHLRELITQYEHYFIVCSRAGGENAPGPVSLIDLVDERVVDMVYGWPSLSGVVDRSEQTLLSALKQEGMDSLEPSPS